MMDLFHAIRTVISYFLNLEIKEIEAEIQR